MTKRPNMKRSKFHVDFADLEIEIRKSIKNDKISEQLGMYIMKITKSILSSTKNVRTYSKENLDQIEFEVYEYIIRKLLVNYDPTKRTGFAFIKSMALNRIASVKRKLYNNGLNPETIRYVADKRTNLRVAYKFLTIDYF
jgi:hypothetical protein